MRAYAEKMPYYRWEHFAAYSNGDGTFHVLVMTDSSGYIFADNLTDQSVAEWVADTLNAALAVANRFSK